jgi:hypothetical protein
MSHPVNQSVLVLIALALGLIVTGLVLVETQHASGQATHMRWNPRRAPSGTEFVGDKACTECHKKAASAYPQSGMALAMESVTQSQTLTRNPDLKMRLGPYTYEIKRQGNQSTYSVTDGKETISLPLVYIFGQGKMGQTYVLQHDGKFYESRVSFYSETKGLDFTLGSPRTVPTSLTDAVGRVLSANELSSCFSCHSTGAVSVGQLQLDKLVHGVRCEGCHGPGGKHISVIKEGESGSEFIFNPAKLTGDELTQQFCASCHRGAEEFSSLKSMGINNVRFQPYRIFNSKCYSDDRRISCTACHNPHEPLSVDAAHYDSKCLDCHALKGKPVKQGSEVACPVATKDCASCHMPKTEIPEAHFKFTDHYIRIAKPGEKFPN